ncbi:hypothetical protein H0H93_004084 [Arthromyces matolae]|nr:hypothetical protein H0H93_004084 [Arthromyces matolae]
MDVDNHHESLLSQLQKLVTIDLDSMDPTVAQHYPQYTFTNMTSNQFIVYNQATHPENKSLVLEAIDYVRALYTHSPSNAVEVADRLMETLDVITIRMALLVYPHLTGKVLAQTSPTFAHDTQKTVAHARRIISHFESHGIPSARVCIKIPATPAGIVACHVLSSPSVESGLRPINTLGTCLFTLEQARAAAQAKCSYISPYYNELRVHFDPTTYVKYEDPLREHPMSAVIASIIAALKGSSTLVMPASLKSVEEVIALARLRPDHLTIPAPLLNELDKVPAVLESELAPFLSGKSIQLKACGVLINVTLTAPPLVEAVLQPTDFIENDGAALTTALRSVPDVERRIQDALSLFGDCELRAMEFVRSHAETLDAKWDETRIAYE